MAVEHRRGGRELALDVEQERCIAGQAEGAFADRRSIVPGEIDRFTAKIGQIGLCRIDKDDLPDAERVTRRGRFACEAFGVRSEEHTSELQSLMRISYAVFCLKTNNMKRSRMCI